MFTYSAGTDRFLVENTHLSPADRREGAAWELCGGVEKENFSSSEFYATEFDLALH